MSIWEADDSSSIISAAKFSLKIPQRYRSMKDIRHHRTYEKKKNFTAAGPITNLLQRLHGPSNHGKVMYHANSSGQYGTICSYWPQTLRFRCSRFRSSRRRWKNSLLAIDRNEGFYLQSFCKLRKQGQKLLQKLSIKVWVETVKLKWSFFLRCCSSSPRQSLRPLWTAVNTTRMKPPNDCYQRFGRLVNVQIFMY